MLTSLSGTHCCTDYSDASGMLLLDVKESHVGREEMLEICGMSKEEQMPKLYRELRGCRYIKAKAGQKSSAYERIL